MKRNNNGFTLVELLGILTILSIIAIIIVPSVDHIIKNGKQKAYDTQRQSLIIAVEDWLSENKKTLNLSEGQEIILTIGDLKSEGYLNFDFKNPLTGDCFSNENEVIISYIDSKYEITINGTLQDGKSEDCKTETALPSIYLIGKNPLKINQGTIYNEPGYTAKSVLGKDLTSRVTVTGTVNTAKIGKTILKYSVSDNGLTKTRTRIVEVLDKEKPLITHPGTTVLNSSVTQFDVMDGVYATDNSGETISIKTVGTVTLGVYGTYFIDYTASDSSGNTTNIRRRIIIADETPGYCFEFDSITSTITGYYQDFKPECNTNIRIPQVINGITVEKIGEYAFYKKNLYSVIMPPSLIKIEGGAFESSNLVEVDFSFATELEYISWHAFALNNIYSLDFTSNDKLHTLDVGAFIGNNFEGTLDLSSAKGLVYISSLDIDAGYNGTFESNNITNLILPKSIVRIGDRAFKNNNITKSNINDLDNLEYIGFEAFKGNSFQSLTINNTKNLKQIGAAAFMRNSLANVTITNNKNLEKIGNDLFKYDGAFEENKISNLVIENNPKLIMIGQGAFWNNQLVNIDLSNTNITKIGDYSFAKNNITKYIFPSTLTYIGSASLNDNKLPDSLAYITQIGDSTSLRSYGGANRVNVSIPSTIRVIDDISFKSNSITSLNFSTATNLIEIDTHAFDDNNIQNLVIENLTNLKYIKDGAFEDNNNMGSVVLNNLPNLLYIGELQIETGSYECGPFDNSGLTSITLTNLPKLKTIGDNAFAWNVIEGNLNFSSFGLASIGNMAFIGSNLTNVTLPTSMNHIGEAAFNGNNFPESSAIIYYPNTNNIVSFAGNSSITPIIKSNVEVIKTYAFYQSLIKNVDMTQATSLKTIDYGAFMYTHLQSITIPSSVEYIGDEAFSITPLTSITVNGTATRFNSRWNKIRFPLSQLPISTITSNLSTSQANDFSYNGNYGYEITVPTTGKYKIQTWGGQGGYRYSSSNGGKGGYTSGEISLTAGDKLYVFVGSSGNNGGYNGGGNRLNLKTAFGGGASDVRIGSTSLYNRVIVAAGGGSEGGSGKAGGYAGGTTGGSRSEDYVGDELGTYCGKGGSQTAGGGSTLTNTYHAYLKGIFGMGGVGYYNWSDNYGGAGGGGWFGGSGTYPDWGSDDDRGGGGGSSYIFTSSTSKISGYALANNYQMTNTVMKAGNESFTSPSGSTVTGNTGNGKVRIEFISQ